MGRETIATLRFLSTLPAAQSRLQSRDKTLVAKHLHSISVSHFHTTCNCASVHAHEQRLDNCPLDRSTYIGHGSHYLRAFVTSAQCADVDTGTLLVNQLAPCSDVSNGKSLLVNQMVSKNGRASENDFALLEDKSNVLGLPSIHEATQSSYGGDVFFESEGSEGDGFTVEKKDSTEKDITLFGQPGKSETAMAMYQILKAEDWPSPDTEAKLLSVARRLSPDLVIEVVKLLKNARTALTFLNWAKQQDGYEPRAEAFTHVIARFGRERDFNSGWSLLVEMKGCKLPIDFAYSIFLHRLKRAKRPQGLVKAMCGMPFLGVTPTVALYTSALEFLLKIGAGGDATHLYKQMLQDGLVPDKKLFEVLVLGFIKIGKLDDALLLFTDMKDRGYVPHVSVYSALIGSMSTTKALEKGHELYEEMIGTGCMPKVFGVDEIACALHGDVRMETVERFLKIVERAPYKWKIQSHNNLLQCLFDSRRCNEARAIFDRIPRDHEGRAKPCKDFVNGYWNLNSYHVYIIGMCKLGQLHHAMDMFKELLNRHLKPTNEISSFLLLSLSKAKMIDEALVFCKYITGEREVVSVDAQHFFFGALRTSGNLSVAVKIFASMKRKGCIDENANFVSLIGLETKDDMSD